jgi:NAD(P)H-dependent flavin oxidoreductase YrpB (nitropropane dioxygenase family)
MDRLEICDLPVLAAPMAGGPTTPALVTAAARAGSMGFLAAGYFTGRVARGISNAFSERYDRAAPAGYPAIHHLTAPLRRWAAGHDDADHLHLWAGTGHRHARPGTTAELLTEVAP